MRCLNPALDTRKATLAERWTPISHIRWHTIHKGEQIIYRTATSLFHFHTSILRTHLVHWKSPNPWLYLWGSLSFKLMSQYSSGHFIWSSSWVWTGRPWLSNTAQCWNIWSRESLLVRQGWVSHLEAVSSRTDHITLGYNKGDCCCSCREQNHGEQKKHRGDIQQQKSSTRGNPNSPEDSQEASSAALDVFCARQINPPLF